MVDRQSLKEIKRKKIDEARKSIEYKEAESEVADVEVNLTPKEEQEIAELAESPEELDKLRQTAINSKKHIEALKVAKRKVNESVPSRHLVQRPGYGHITATTQLHSRGAYNFFLGREQQIKIVNGKRVRQTRIVGLTRAAAGLKRITAGYQSGCPYAAWTLIKIDDQIEKMQEAIKQSQIDAEKLRQFASHIKIEPFCSKTPTEITLDFKSSYAYHFANLLIEYDLLLRSILNYKIHGFITHEDYRTIESTLGTPLRHLFRLADSWHFVGKEAVESKNAKLQEAEHRMGILPKDILSGERTPKFVANLQGDDDE